MGSLGNAGNAVDILGNQLNDPNLSRQLEQQNAYQVGAAPTTGYQAQNAQAANINASGAQPYANAQQGLLGALQAQAAGAGGPTLAQNQLQSGLNATLASQLSAQAAQRGLNPGQQQSNIQNQAAQAAAQAAGASAQTRAQEQMNSQGQLGQLTGQGVNQAAQQAQLTQQAALANQAAQNTQSQFGSNQQQQNWQFGQGIGAQQQSQYNQALYDTSATQQKQNNQNLNTAVQGVGGLLNSVGGLVGLSDENEKTDISPVDTSGMLEAMHASAYRYKDPSAPGAAPGMHVGPMAQELERDPVGATTVVQNPDGTKGVDTGRLALTLAGALAQMHERVNALEKKKGK